jgi:AcrR family transcriptional regulator
MGRPAVHKDALHRAALQLLNRHGVQGVAVRDIARHAGISEGALYRHYPSKQALVLTLYESGIAPLENMLQELETTSPELESFVSGLVIHLILFYRQAPELCCYTLHPAPDVLAMLPAGQPRADQLLQAALLPKLVGRPVDDRPPALLIAQLIGSVLHPLLLHQRGVLPCDPQQTVDGLVQSALRLVRQ